MTVDDQTSRSRTTVQHFMAGDFDALADDAEIWLAAALPVNHIDSTDAAVVTKADLLAMMDSINAQGRTRYRITTTGVTAEGRRVAVEAEGHIELLSGASYPNKYHLLFEAEGDRIVAMREYSDTRLIERTFGPKSIR